MAEYIGSRISLISKRDIRYVGTLHEISSENSTVALEQVTSFGTEDRNAKPNEFVPPSDNVYEYIVFRGSDVKDLRIEKEPEKPTSQPQVPDDPAILGNSRPSGPQAGPAGKKEEAASRQSGPPPQQPNPFHDQHGPPPRYPQQWSQGYPPNQRFGGPPGFAPYGPPGMQYGPPPGWYGPPGPGPGFPPGPPGQFYPHQNTPHGPFGHPPGPPRPPSKPATPAEIMAGQAPPQQPPAAEKQAATVKLPSSSTTPVPTAAAPTAPKPPTESKPDVAAALAPPVPTGPAALTGESTAKAAPVTKSGRIQPAVPILASRKPSAPVNGTAPSKVSEPSSKPAPPSAPTAPKSYADANADARAAVAAAMAKLSGAHPQAKPTNGDTSAVDHLTKKVNEMRTDDNARSTRGGGAGGPGSGYRGTRGGYRGGRPRTESQTKTIEVPKTDYDFATANAKLNKQDVLKEVTSGGSPSVGTPVEGTNSESGTVDGSAQEHVVIPPAPIYNKTASFFDNISSESKDREDNAAKKLGGREFRSEETKKNLETFGQGSVDGRRGGYRGRGRGRGFRGGRGRGAFRGSASAIVG